MTVIPTSTDIAHTSDGENIVRPNWMPAYHPGTVGLAFPYGNSTSQIAGAAFSSLFKLDATAVPYKSTL